LLRAEKPLIFFEKNSKKGLTNAAFGVIIVSTKGNKQGGKTP